MMTHILLLYDGVECETNSRREHHSRFAPHIQARAHTLIGTRSLRTAHARACALAHRFENAFPLLSATMIADFVETLDGLYADPNSSALTHTIFPENDSRIYKVNKINIAKN